MLSGRVNEDSFVPLNALAPTEVKEAGKETLVKLAHLLKASFPILITPFGMVTLIKAVDQKALFVL